MDRKNQPAMEQGPAAVLIVDDEEAIRHMLVRILEPRGYDIFQACDGKEAFDMCRVMAFDLIITDLNMPNMDGLTMLENIRKEKVDSACIILTGYGDLPQALSARDRYNISNFLIKPIQSLDQFLFEVDSALSRRILEQEKAQLLQTLQDVNADLEDKVRQRTRELEEKNRQIEQVSNFRGDILKVLGHELRTPLAILNGYHQLGAQGALPFESVSEQVGGSIGRLREIVEKSLLHLRDPENAGFPLDLSPVSPAEICRNVMERIKPLMEARNIKLELREGPPDTTCTWDREKVEVLVEELLINAVRATPDGKSVLLEIDRISGDVLIRVIDQGHGVAEADMERIFEPFVTLGKVEHHRSGMLDYGAKGVGIGLSTARLWAELHQGTLNLQPGQPGQGAVFICRLPIQALDVTTAGALAPSAADSV
ncbi:MAG: response regulator [Deltaproteobacteria bacterium]|nr:response regulator [Deltaproteobacteria bacterium]